MANAAQVVNAYLTAFWSGDFAAAGPFVADDFSFRGPLPQTDTKATFFASAAPLAPIVRSHRLVRQWVDGDDVGTVYECMLEPPAALMRAYGDACHGARSRCARRWKNTSPAACPLLLHSE